MLAYENAGKKSADVLQTPATHLREELHYDILSFRMEGVPWERFVSGMRRLLAGARLHWTLAERFDRRGTEPFELFRSEFLESVENH